MRRIYNTAQWEDHMHTALQSHDYAVMRRIYNTAQWEDSKFF